MIKTLECSLTLQWYEHIQHAVKPQTVVVSLKSAAKYIESVTEQYDKLHQ